jgi:hypothetical protein
LRTSDLNFDRNATAYRTLFERLGVDAEKTTKTDLLE